MIGRAEIEAAKARIAPHIRFTPVLRLEEDTLGIGRPVWLKLEHLQATGSFKVRGAFNNLLSAKRLPKAGVVAASGGNHGAAVAYAASRLGAPSTIFVPKAIADPVKIARMEGFGAKVILAEGSVAEVMSAYRDHARQTGALDAHPYDTAPTLEGQGTLGLEIERQTDDSVDTVFVSVGGGGLIGGIAAWFGGKTKVVAVETEGTATLARTLEAGERVTLSPSGIAASSLGGPNIGDMPMAVLRENLGGNVVVSDADVREAQRRLWEAARIVGEPGAAVALAPLVSGAYKPAPDETPAVLICGGNAAPGWFGDAP